MKKVLFILAFVAVYGVSMAMSDSAVVTIDETQVTIVADMDDNNVVALEGEKEKEKKAAKAKSKTKAKTDAKAKGCSGEKSTEAKKGCGSSCGGEKK